MLRHWIVALALMAPLTAFAQQPNSLDDTRGKNHKRGMELGIFLSVFERDCQRPGRMVSDRLREKVRQRMTDLGVNVDTAYVKKTVAEFTAGSPKLSSGECDSYWLVTGGLELELTGK